MKRQILQLWDIEKDAELNAGMFLSALTEMKNWVCEDLRSFGSKKLLWCSSKGENVLSCLSILGHDRITRHPGKVLFNTLYLQGAELSCCYFASLARGRQGHPWCPCFWDPNWQFFREVQLLAPRRRHKASSLFKRKWTWEAPQGNFRYNTHLRYTVCWRSYLQRGLR